MFDEQGKDGIYWNTYNETTMRSVLYSSLPQKAWNESCMGAACGTNKPALLAGGGGASKFHSKPSWQTGIPGIIEDNARDIPDVSLTAAVHDGYLVCIDNSCTPDSAGRISFALFSGTSAAAPSFAGIIAHLVQYAHGRQGQINPNLYRLAATQDWSQCESTLTFIFEDSCLFHDIRSGDNAVPGQSDYGTGNPSYQAKFGYDMATGLGSVRANNLVLGWQSATGLGMAHLVTSQSGLNFFGH